MRREPDKNDVNLNTSGIEVSLQELIALRKKAQLETLHIKKKSSGLFAGENLAKVRGRGIEFDTTREYQPGDDIRRMAWRVTARSLKPHVKVYQEEKERPVWLSVDLSPSLYFGTRCMFKSVCSIKQAAFVGWSHLQKHERIGAFVATPKKMSVYRPQARDRAFLSILQSLSDSSRNVPAFTETNCLNELLKTMQQYVRVGNLIFILSDFFEFDAQNKKLILHMAQRAQINLVFVYDPFEAVAPPAYRYRLTNGERTALFDMAHMQNRKYYEQQFQDKLSDLVNFARQHSMSLQVLRTDQTQVEFAK